MTVIAGRQDSHTLSAPTTSTRFGPRPFVHSSCTTVFSTTFVSLQPLQAAIAAAMDGDFAVTFGAAGVFEGEGADGAGPGAVQN